MILAAIHTGGAPSTAVALAQVLTDRFDVAAVYPISDLAGALACAADTTDSTVLVRL